MLMLMPDDAIARLRHADYAAMLPPYADVAIRLPLLIFISLR